MELDNFGEAFRRIPLRIWCLSILMSIWTYVMIFSENTWGGFSVVVLVFLVFLYILTSIVTAQLPFSLPVKFQLLILATITALLLNVAIALIRLLLYLIANNAFDQLSVQFGDTILVVTILSYGLLIMPAALTSIVILIAHVR